MNSALATIRAAVPTAKLVEAGPDLVGRTGAAESMVMSRQNLRKLMVANPATLPVPVHQGSSGVWHLADFLAWLHAQMNPHISRGYRRIFSC